MPSAEAAEVPPEAFIQQLKCQTLRTGVTLETENKGKDAAE